MLNKILNKTPKYLLNKILDKIIKYLLKNIINRKIYQIKYQKICQIECQIKIHN